MKTLRAWLAASRLPSQSYIALPLILGQVLALQNTGAWSWTIFALVQAFGIFDQLYIVYANDYADRDTDALNQTSTIFSGGSRVLVEGSLTPLALRRAAAFMAAMALGVGVALLVGWQRTFAMPLIALGLGLLWAYSYAPLRLSYRGGGEVLQMLGVGLVLPLLGYEAQAGTLASFPSEVLAFSLPLNLATGICTALPDEPSDRISHKHTLAVKLGGAGARGLILSLNSAGLALFLWLAYPRLDLETSAAALLALPVGSVLLQIAIAPHARPGSRAILGFVFFGLLANLSLVAGLVVDLASR